MSRGGPSPEELRRAAATLEALAADAEKTATQVSGTSRSLQSLPGRVQDAIANTATRVDHQVVGQLGNCGQGIAQAADALRATATQARRSAEEAKAQAAKLEREQERQAKSKGGRR